MSDEQGDIDELVRTINENPDPLHGDYTPSVVQLRERGLKAAVAVLDLLDDPNYETRLRAQRVVEDVVKRRFGWAPGQGFTDLSQQEKTQDLFAANGNYQAGAPPEERKKSIEKWRRWLEEQK
jgi:hypothetical protein